MKRKIKSNPNSQAAAAHPFRAAARAAQYWLLLLMVLQLLLPYLVIQFFVGAETSSGTPLPGWVWGAAFFILLLWLAYQMVRIFALDLKRREPLMIRPFFLKRYRRRVSLTTLLRLTFFYVPLLATLSTNLLGYHAGLTAVASLYLGLGLFGLLALGSRRRAWRQWLGAVLPEQPVASIQRIDTFEEISGAGTYALTNYPAWAICIAEHRGSYRAEVQVEQLEGVFSVCDAHGRPKTVKQLPKLVGEMSKVDGAYQAEVDEILSRLGVTL